MSLPELHHNKLTTALAQAIYIAHTNKNHASSLTILIPPDWNHTPYLARNLHTNYVQHIATIPHTHTHTPPNTNNAPNTAYTYT